MKKTLLITLLMMSASFATQAARLSMNFNGLEDLGPTARYEGWLIVEGSPVSTGVFTVDAAGNPSTSMVEVDDSFMNTASLFVLTIEPFPDNNPAPADTHILAGSIAGGVADLSVEHPAAIGDNFLSSTGSFILAVPSDTGGLGGYQNGIWYLTPPNPDAGLNLPTLPAGWTYEGWVVDTAAGTPISTGLFTSVTGSDSDAGGASAGPGGTPPFPGQDFINPLRDLTNSHLAVISIEPVPDNSAAPFTLKPLVTSITDTGGPGISQGMTNNAAATNPTGRISLLGSPQSVPSLGFMGILLLLLSVAFMTRLQFKK